MDFYHVAIREIEKGPYKGMHEVYPDWIVGRSQDLMVRGGSFHAVWDEEAGLWSTDEYDVQRLVDREVKEWADNHYNGDSNAYIQKRLRSFNSNGWAQFRKFMHNISDNSRQLDNNLTFSNTIVKKEDHASKRLSYALEPGDYSAWDELVGTLYSVEERAKIEWAIGSVISGDSKKIHKFVVFYGPGGTGKSTILSVIERLFDGYATKFDAKALGTASNAFATEAFRSNPLVAIDHDTDLSRIDDNSRLNSIISHEEILVNEKFKPAYSSRVNAMLFIGTNKPVKITDAKSGLIRRLIDIHPTGIKIPENHYHTLMSKIDFELGAIAAHCLEVYRSMGRNYYSSYRPLEMMFQTDIFFNYVEAHYDIFKKQDYVTLRQAYTLYKEFCSDTGIEKPLPQYRVREELRNYFDEFHERHRIDDEQMRSVYTGFKGAKFKEATPEKEEPYSLVLEETTSLLEEVLADCPAQGSKIGPSGSEIPIDYWDNVTTTLKDIDTSLVHFVKVPENHIVIDFDLKDEDGRKSLDRNLAAASSWPVTYAELSKSGSGVHLHYIYTGPDLELLSSAYSDGVEVKRYAGNASLRRLGARSNGIPIAELPGGLPLKEKKLISQKKIQSERGLREMIERNLRKEFHAGTKPSVDFIWQILEDAYASGMPYDVSDMKSTLIGFANGSTNQAIAALARVSDMKFKSDTLEDIIEHEDAPLVVYDVEVFPNLFVICWKYFGSEQVTRMINPTAQEVESLFKFRLVGFNCRRYDNHVLYAAYMGYDNESLYKLSQQLINNKGFFGEAYNLSYTDIYDYATKKQGLKKWEIELGIHHMELGLPWDEPVDESLWETVADYCVNDVNATEEVMNHTQGDLMARKILADLSGLTVNDKTNSHTARIIFGRERNPQEEFVYTDLSVLFPGYKYDAGNSTYRGEVTGEGGYVYAEPGIYENVALLDVTSMHPTSAIELNLFGDRYTPKFKELVDARVAIKTENPAAKTMLDGRLAPYLDDPGTAKAVSDALKIAINSVYGMTSARFDNPFKDPRNKDNIVAKRGALFMVDLKSFVQEQGFTVAHIKTDSIKIPNATPEIIEAVAQFGAEYGYNFEHEATYSKLCLVNEAVYIAKKDPFVDNKSWVAVGAQFQHPYVYKTLFSMEELTARDLQEAKQVAKGSMYLDFEGVNRPAALSDGEMQHIGRTGLFTPVTEGSGGGLLYRVYEEKKYAVSGTKGYFWVEAEMFDPNTMEVDESYFEKLADDAVSAIEKFGSFDKFVK